MKIALPDGRSIEISDAASSAFAALYRGEATSGQQKRCLQTILDLGQPFVILMGQPPERVVGLMDGAKWLALQVAKLAAGDAPFILKRPGEDDGGSD